MQGPATGLKRLGTFELVYSANKYNIQKQMTKETKEFLECNIKCVNNNYLLVIIIYKSSASESRPSARVRLILRDLPPSSESAIRDLIPERCKSHHRRTWC